MSMLNSSIETSIRYSRQTRAYDGYLVFDGEDHYVGSRATYSPLRRCATRHTTT